MPETLQKKLLSLLSNPQAASVNLHVIETITENSITIYEKDKKGKVEVSFKNGVFVRLNADALGDNKFIDLFNKQEGATLRTTCDGIFLAHIDRRIVLCLVELKKTINNNFPKAVKQLVGGYLKAAMLLSLFCNVKDIQLAAFIGGGLKPIDQDPDLLYLQRTGEFTEEPNNPARIEREFFQNRKVHMNFPFHLADTIHNYYHKKKVSLFHLEDQETFDLLQLDKPE